MEKSLSQCLLTGFRCMLLVFQTDNIYNHSHPPFAYLEMYTLWHIAQSSYYHLIGVELVSNNIAKNIRMLREAAQRSYFFHNMERCPENGG